MQGVGLEHLGAHILERADGVGEAASPAPEGRVRGFAFVENGDGGGGGESAEEGFQGQSIGVVRGCKGSGRGELIRCRRVVISVRSRSCRCARYNIVRGPVLSLETHKARIEGFQGGVEVVETKNKQKRNEATCQRKETSCKQPL